MLQELNKTKQLQQVYTHHDCLLQWAFSSPPNAQVFGSVVLQEWLTHSTNQNADDMDSHEKCTYFLLDLISSNQLFFPAIFELLVEGSEETLAQLLPVLEICCGRLKWEDQWDLLQDLSDIFCSFVRIAKERETGIQEPNYVAILRTIYQLQCLVVEKSKTESTDLKVLYNVCNTVDVLTKEDAELWSLLYLYTCVNESSANQDTRVLGILLSHAATLNKLAEHLSSSTPQPVCLNLVSCLTYYQAKHKIQVLKSLSLEWSTLLRFISSSWSELATASVQLLSILLQRDFSSKFIVVHYNNTNLSTLLTATTIPSPSTKSLLRHAYFALQNASVKDDSSLQDAAFDCLGIFLGFIDKVGSFNGNHLQQQPWIATIFFIHMERLLNGNWPQGIRLLNLFLEFKHKNSALPKFVEVLVPMLLEKTSGPIDQNDNYSSHMLLLKKISHSVYYNESISQSLRQQIDKKLNEVTNLGVS